MCLKKVLTDKGFQAETSQLSVNCYDIVLKLRTSHEYRKTRKE